MNKNSMLTLSTIEEVDKLLGWLKNCPGVAVDKELHATIQYLKKYKQYMIDCEAESEKRVTQFLDTPLIRETCKPERMGKIVESIEKDKKASKESFDAGLEIIRSPEFFQTWQTVCKAKTIKLEELDSLNFSKKIHDNILLLFSILLVAVGDMSADDPRRLHLDRIEAYDYAKKCGKNPKVEDYTEFEFEGSPDEYLFKCKYYDRCYILLLTVEQGSTTLTKLENLKELKIKYGEDVQEITLW